MRKMLFPKLILAGVLLNFALLNISSCSQEKKQETVTNPAFIGFEDDTLTYTFPGLSISKKVHINKISSNYYCTAEPIELFVSKEQSFSFNLLTRDASVSKRCRYFLDNTKQIHPISLFVSPDDFIIEPPSFNVSNPSIRTDQIYVNLECDTSVYLQINCRIWSSPQPENGVKLFYNRTGLEDLNTIEYDGFAYSGTALCPSKKFHNDFLQHMKIMCETSGYQYSDLSCEVVPSKDTTFASCLNFNAIMTKTVINDKFYYTIDLNYMFFKEMTPTKEEIFGQKPTVFTLSILQNDDIGASYQIGFCDFRIVWI